MDNIIVIRGGGDLATGTIHKLAKCGYKVLVTETQYPSAIRRRVSLSEAIYYGYSTVEGVTAHFASNLKDAYKIIDNGEVPVLIDPQCEIVRDLKPAALIDATISKVNIGTYMDMAPVTIGLGPGYEAGKDVTAVIETQRGHNLGRIIWKGCASANTGIPGVVGGCDIDRVIYSEVGGNVHNILEIGCVVEKGNVLAYVGDVPFKAKITGLIRGIIRDGYPVKAGMKLADIDPRKDQLENCDTISDKARCIAGGVLEALMSLDVLPWK